MDSDAVEHWWKVKDTAGDLSAARYLLWQVLNHGGPIMLLPAVRQEWSGQFKLRTRGGFLVTAEFEPGRKLTRATVECERCGPLRLTNPFGKCRGWHPDQLAATIKDPLIAMETQPGETVEFVWSPHDGSPR